MPLGEVSDSLRSPGAPLLTPISLYASWLSVKTKIKEYAIAFLLLEAAMIGTFVSLDLFFFYVPFGWPFLTLTRHFRRPPCGYRGLSRAERREREGIFHWHLRERPLP